MHDDSLRLANGKSPRDVSTLPQSSTQPVRQASYSMELGHDNAVNQKKKGVVLGNAESETHGHVHPKGLTAEAGAPPVHTYSSLSTEACIGGYDFTHVGFVTCLLLTLGKEYVNGNVRMAGFECLQTQGLTSCRCRAHA